MNIALFTLAYSPFEGGAEIAAREIVNRLKEHNFSIFTYKFNKHWLSLEHGENYDVIRVGFEKNVLFRKTSDRHVKADEAKTKKYYGRIWDKISYIYKSWQEAEKIHKHKRYDAIWVLMASYGGIAALFFKLNHPSIPMLLTLQEGDSEKHLVFGKFGLVGWFGKKIIQKANFIQTISKYLANFAIKRGATCPIEVVPNGVDMDLFETKYSQTEIKLLRDNLGITDEYIVFTASRLVVKNGVDILVKAIAKLKETRPNIKLLIAGDGPELPKLKHLTFNLKLEGNVIFLGQVAQKNLPIYFKISNVFVRASRSEGLGNSFLEAMAAEIPVIGTPVGGIVDFLFNYQTGLIMNPEDSADLAEKISYIISHPDARTKIVKNAKNLVDNHYSWEIVARKMGRIFSNLKS